MPEILKSTALKLLVINLILTQNMVLRVKAITHPCKPHVELLQTMVLFHRPCYKESTEYHFTFFYIGYPSSGSQ